MSDGIRSLTIVLRSAKYQPYDAGHRRFWRQYLKQYDTDDTGCISHIELTSMLDSLGSTLSPETVNSFFTRFSRRPQEDTITVNGTIQCLEAEISRPSNEKKRLEPNDSAFNTSTPATPSANGNSDEQLLLDLDKLDFAGPPLNLSLLDQDGLHTVPPTPYRTEPMQQPLSASASLPSHRSLPANIGRHPSGSSSDQEEYSGSGSSPSNGSEELFERVINVKNCPMCHRLRLTSRAEVDIVTHLAVRASQDWATVDRIMVGNFVTASQAQRKWYTKVITKVSSGNYKPGAVRFVSFYVVRGRS